MDFNDFQNFFGELSNQAEKNSVVTVTFLEIE